MKVSLHVVDFNWSGTPRNTGAKLAEIAQVAEEVGFDTLWVGDHLFQAEYVGNVGDAMLEAYSTLNFIAGVTQRIRLGAMVTAVTYRHPGVLVKMLSTLDVLSGGRAWLGIGAGWYEREARGLGLPFPPLKERFERLEETLQIVQRMWSGDFSPFVGKHYQLAEPINSPQPLTKPHPPILIGGSGEEKTLRMVAQYGDACNLYPISHEVIAHKLDVLKRHCDTLGRDYDEIERTLQVSINRPGISTAAEIIANSRAWAKLGIQHVNLLQVPNIADVASLEALGREVISALDAIPV